MHLFTPPGLVVSRVRHQGTVAEQVKDILVRSTNYDTNLFFEYGTLFVILWKLLIKVLDLRTKFEGEMLVEHVKVSC